MIRLRDLRGEKTQAYVAQKLNINRQTYCNYENGSRQMDYDTLIKIAQFYNVTIDYLLGASDAPYGENATYDIELAPEEPDERKLLDIYREVKQKGGYALALKFMESWEIMLKEEK